MPILFTCPHCGLQTHVGDEYVGQSGPCARCGNVVTVPRSCKMAGPAPRPPSRGMSGLVITLIVLGVLGGFMFLCMGPCFCCPRFRPLERRLDGVNARTTSGKSGWPCTTTTACTNVSRRR